ncbi:type I DNA topoisomerase [SAR202 cluster bacterium AC-409-J13_OGT_754m]|nr:type I DNA topoisomerase [SAR202 cluster bacterium AC-409-J13_OGT_754m]
MAAKTKKNITADLVVVESPAKAKTIARILGNKYKIVASLGHVRDLPKGKLGIDIDNGFVPSYSVMKPKAAVVKELKALGKDARSIYLATDPDREGEAISWHLINATGWDKSDKTLKRVSFHEITEEAISSAFEHPRELDYDLINAQQARRILDRIVGYQLSPLLWKKVRRGLSAGRVQSVTLRLICDREKEIDNFTASEYWTIAVSLLKESTPFVATLSSIKGQKGKLAISTAKEADAIETVLKESTFKVKQVKIEDKQRKPSPPFMTSTLQQEAWRKFKFSPKRTMVIAQQLYEGIQIGGKGTDGLITYMRTDSTSLSITSVNETRKYIAETYGNKYLPPSPRIYKTKSKTSQEAHEAIRPTSILRVPDLLRANLSNDQLKIYKLIWSRMLSCQMTNAIYESTSVDIESTSKDNKTFYILKANNYRSKFPGFATVYVEDTDEETNEPTENLPSLGMGDLVSCQEIQKGQHFTQPPPRFTEASLIKLLDQQGIGRPSTYAPTLSTISDRGYVVKDKRVLHPTELGVQVSDLLKQFFPNVMDVGFTAQMEDELDEIARGEREWVPMLQAFYLPFKKTLDEAQTAMPLLKIEKPTDEVCDKCNKPMVIKTGRFGEFTACSGFPDCKNIKKSNDEKPTNEVCNKCNKPMVIKAGRFGEFMACTGYPNCKNTKAILSKIGVQCPECRGDIVQKRSKAKFRVFFGCANYPDCKFAVFNKPLTTQCPECDGLMVMKGRNKVACLNCAWQGDPPSKDET